MTTWEQKQDAIEWLQDREEPEAETALALIDAAESRENTVLGMCMARRPHTEIRDYLMAEAVQA